MPKNPCVSADKLRLFPKSRALSCQRNFFNFAGVLERFKIGLSPNAGNSSLKKESFPAKSPAYLATDVRCFESG